MSLRIDGIDIDSTNPAVVADFWQAALGWRRTYEDDDEIVLEPAEGSAEEGRAPDILFLRVPESKSVKNRLHLDLRPEDQAAEVERLEVLGAVRVNIGQSDDVSWVVMADPEGNEFCVLSSSGADDRD